MIDFTTGVIMLLLTALAGTFCYFFGLHKAPKATHFTALRKDMEETIAGLRTEKKRALALASYYKKGVIPAHVGDVANAGSDDPAPLVDAIIASLPENWRGIAMTFRDSMVDEMKKDPESVKKIIQIVKTKTARQSDAEGQEQAATADAL